MPQISHSNFSHMSAEKPQQDLKRSIIGSKPQPNIYTVAPPDADEAAFEAQMAAQEAGFASQMGPQTGIPGIMSDAVVQAELDKKRVFEKLVLFRGDHVTEVEAGGLKFKFKLLNANENAYVLKQMKKIPADEQVSKLSLMVLAAALVDVNGMKLEEASSAPAEITDPVLRRYYEINNWASPITNALGMAYHRFQTETEAAYTKDFLDK